MSVEFNQVYQPRDPAARPVIVTAPPDNWLAADEPGQARIADFHTGKWPRWITPADLLANYELDPEQS